MRRFALSAETQVESLIECFGGKLVENPTDQGERAHQPVLAQGTLAAVQQLENQEPDLRWENGRSWNIRSLVEEELAERNGHTGRPGASSGGGGSGGGGDGSGSGGGGGGEGFVDGVLQGVLCFSKNKHGGGIKSPWGVIFIVFCLYCFYFLFFLCLSSIRREQKSRLEGEKPPPHTQLPGCFPGLGSFFLSFFFFFFFFFLQMDINTNNSQLSSISVSVSVLYWSLLIN